MGRKRWWMERCPLWVLLLVLLHGSTIQGDGGVGCLFDQNVCKSGEETCYDDAAFGKCMKSFNRLDNDMYRYDLDPAELELLKTQLEKLVDQKYQWSHPYTQCVMQNALFSVRYQTEHDLQYCQDLEELNENVFAEFMDGDKPEDQEIRPLAVVNFAPSRGHGYGDFANEMYYPPASSTFDEPQTEEIFVPYSDPIRKSARHPTLNFNENRRDGPLDEKEFLVVEDNSSNDNKYDEELSELSKRFDEYTGRLTNFKSRENQEPMFRSRREPRMEDSAHFRSLGEDLSKYLELRDIPENLGGNWQSERINNSFRGSTTLFDLVKANKMKNQGKLNFLLDNSGYREIPGYQESDANDENNFFDQEDDFPSESENDGWDDFQAFFESRGISGFKRPERLDVKKPGPQFSPNNFAFSVPTENSDTNVELEKKKETRGALVKKEMMAGKDITLLSPSETYDNVDTDYVYLQFDKPIHNWKGGENIVKQAEKLIGLNFGDLSNIRVGNAEVTFKVNENALGMNATDIALHIGGIRNELRSSNNMDLLRGGLGDKTKLPPLFNYMRAEPTMSSHVFGAMIAAAVAAAATAAVLTLFVARYHAKSRAKLAGLATPDPEASKDYQELCRARMQAKQPAEKPESPRIISLSRESESNRSSTSSWGGEEAAALANMDISTGHMVLSYMEDHLKNKDRLDQEWAAICAYEAIPSSIAIATSKDNAERNRSGAAPSYDHSRIVLNDLSNVNSSDYINASTITDHDPRNPAYIATQGPLPQTSADFWQLVWEQGSVVIVMLTRLTEEGCAMCHRYWPEEGSELYHIYEVHLVSEHIWCDDYLVRSFYLKNLRTGETRTVTQFHFLSWPENGVPHSTKALLEFRRKVNKSYRGRSCPIVVHCSDGAGRTGTYCLIDMVLNRMAKGAKEIDIAAALEHIRDQRPGMVATKQQFEFVLVAVAEEVHAILKALPVQVLEKTPSTQASTSSNSEK